MSSNMADQPVDPRIYLAAERTFLAWLRTGIALMGFGFVVSRFGLFLRELASNQLGTGQKVINAAHAGLSLPVGVFLILLGILVMIMAAVRHQGLITALDKGQFRSSFRPAFGFWLAGLLALFGLAVAYYLVFLF